MMSRHKAKNLHEDLGDFPSSGVSKATPSNPPSALGKRGPTDPVLDPDGKRATGKSPAKPSDDFDPLSMWLEDCSPSQPPQPSPSSGRKGPSGPICDSHSFLGNGITGSPSLALQLGKSALLPFDMNMYGAISDHDLLSIRV